MRLDKAIASQGNYSRSEVRKLVSRGQISVNGALCRSAAADVEPERDEIRIGGALLPYQKYRYLMLNKPLGVVSATEDRRQKTVLDLVPEQWNRPGLFPAGRLDADTTGFILLTDDGAFAHRILSPRSHIRKTYVAELADPLTEEAAEQLRNGIVLRDGTECLPAEVEPLGERTVQIRIIEGKYHEIKRMTAASGNRVVSLRRTAMGGLSLDPDLQEGECREISPDELKILEEGTGLI